jgi:hypothetical protein
MLEPPRVLHIPGQALSGATFYQEGVPSRRHRLHEPTDGNQIA